ncbi:MAG: ABC transporter permease [Saprospiraceae bacterium]
MKKLWLIIQREYLTRVKKRTFILTTLLTPLGIAAFIMLASLIFGYESDDAKKIAIVDESGIMKQRITDESNLYFKFEKQSLAELKENFGENGYSGILVIPPVKDVKVKSHDIFYYAEEQLGLDMQAAIQGKVRRAIRDYKATELNIDQENLKLLDTKVSLDPEPITETANNDSKFTSAIGAGLGMFMGFIMYTIVFIYGMMVMRGVMEEKTSRISEVMISSVRPIQLMLGKIIGIGGVGLTQLAIWLVLIPGTVFLVQVVLGIDANQMTANANMPNNIDPSDFEEMAVLMAQEIDAINWWKIIPLFIFYFLGGYFLYASLFAAVGSAVGDDTGDSQALTLPISLPVILALYIMMVAVQSPNSSLAVWSSIFPLFAPIVMPARLAFNPPLWQILLSMASLVLTIILIGWLAGRIYRIGILMYGKRTSFKELGKWLFYKN